MRCDSCNRPVDDMDRHTSADCEDCSAPICTGCAAVTDIDGEDYEGRHVSYVKAWCWKCYYHAQLLDEAETRLDPSRHTPRVV